jgi:uncharacterized protein (DUF952 family)/ribosomal protein S18 acetylase RimI-like enzyme
MARVYHITTAGEAAAARGGEYTPARFAAEGFIHCSHVGQVLAVADALYRAQPDVVLLEIDPARVPARVVEEDLSGSGQRYPHVYSGLPMTAVVAVHRLTPGAEGRFTLPREVTSPVCREAVPADAAALGHVHVAAWRGAYAGVMPAAFLAGLDPERFRQRWDGWLRAGATALVVESGAAIAGFCLHGRSRDADAGPTVGEVIGINVHPASWRQGLGRALFLESVARLRRDFGEATLWVVRENQRARAFYETLDWRPDGTERTDYQLTGAAVHEVRYRSAL